MAGWERQLGGLVERNNRRVRAADPVRENPRSLAGVAWHDHLVDRFPTIRHEWDTFTVDRRLPHIGDVLGEHQGNEGAWLAGLLVTNGRVTDLGHEHFPSTVSALQRVPGLRAALWSELAPHAEITEHVGPNAGVLRYHLGVRCPDSAALQIGSAVVPYRDREGILFDDTAPHAAWNRSDTPRVTLFCELDRPLGGRAAVENRVMQTLLGWDPRRRRLFQEANAWHHALNPYRTTRPHG